MHREITDFLSKVKADAGLGTKPAHHVVEVGSYILDAATGSAREVFQPIARHYKGIDHRPGPGVDVVSLAHLYTPAMPADVAVCCQVLEHDPYWPLTLVHLVWLVRSGGVVAVTCAGPGYVAHEMDTSPGYVPGEPAYYRNVSAAEVEQTLRAGARYIDLDVVEIHAVEQRNRYGMLDTLAWARFAVSDGT